MISNNVVLFGECVQSNLLFVLRSAFYHLVGNVLDSVTNRMASLASISISSTTSQTIMHSAHFITLPPRYADDYHNLTNDISSQSQVVMGSAILLFDISTTSLHGEVALPSTSLSTVFLLLAVPYRLHAYHPRSDTQ